MSRERNHKMTLNVIRTLVNNSSRCDWHKHVEAQAVFSPDIDISLDWSETVNPNFSEPWHQCLHDTGASSVSVELRHNGVPVDSWTFVIVDGGRYILPLPSPATGGGYELSSAMMPLGNLLFDLYHPGGASNTLAALLQRCTINIV